MADSKYKIMPASEFRARLETAIRCSQWEEVINLKNIEAHIYEDGPQQGQPHLVPTHSNLNSNTVVYDRDPHSGEPTLRINVEHMVRSYVGEGYDIKVAFEEWNTWKTMGNLMTEPDPARKIVIHLCKHDDNPGLDVITLREMFASFPSEELRGKLQLLRYK